MPTGIYDRYQGANDGVDAEHRRCSKCRVIQTLDRFSPDRRNKTFGLQSICKVCRKAQSAQWRENNPEEHKRRTRENYLKHRHQRAKSGLEWKRRNTKRVRGYMLKERYGLTNEEFVAMVASQGNACAICTKPFGGGKKAPHTDHDHLTGLVRGILCAGCNLGLGYVEKPGYLRAAYAYLAAHAMAAHRRGDSAA